MNSTLKRTVSILLAVIMSFSCVIIAAADVSDATSPIPVVYVEGQGSALYTDKNSNKSEKIYPVTVEDGYIGDNAKLLISPLLKGAATGNWTEYCDVLYDAVAPVFEKIVLDDNGDASNGSGNTWKWNVNSLKNKAVNGRYNLYAYTYHYDWRLDPCVLADGLSDYIEGVKQANGCSKVNLVGRCLGANIVLAYLDEYGAESINDVVFYCAGFDGFMICGKCFSGQIAVDGAAVNRYIVDYLGSDYIMELIKSSVTLANKVDGMLITSALFDSIYSKIYDNLVPRLLMATFATTPSYWSMVGDEFFEPAKKLVFGTDTEKYAGLIEKIDHYHYDIMMKTEDIIDRAKADGANVYNICKYGLQIVPVFKDGNIQSDEYVETVSSSMGATCSAVDETLSDEYIKQAEARGASEYISADKQIDASTGYLPDSTWYIKNITHKQFPESIDVLFEEIFDFNGQMTVNDSETFAQFMLYSPDTETLEKLTEDNSPVHDEWNVGFFKAFADFFKKLINFFIVLINKIEIK